MSEVTPEEACDQLTVEAQELGMYEPTQSASAVPASAPLDVPELGYNDGILDALEWVLFEIQDSNMRQPLMEKVLKKRASILRKSRLPKENSTTEEKT